MKNPVSINLPLRTTSMFRLRRKFHKEMIPDWTWAQIGFHCATRSHCNADQRTRNAATGSCVLRAYTGWLHFL